MRYNQSHSLNYWICTKYTHTNENTVTQCSTNHFTSTGHHDSSQVEDKKRREAELKEKIRMEEEKEERRLAEQREKMQRDFEEEQQRQKNKEEEVSGFYQNMCISVRALKFSKQSLLYPFHLAKLN